MSKKNELVRFKKHELVNQNEEKEDKHPWDDLNVFQVIFGLFIVGAVYGIIVQVLF